MQKLLDEVIKTFRTSRVTVVRLLLVDSSLLLIRDKEDKSNLLMKACQYGNPDLVKLILSSRFCTEEVVFHKGSSGTNALMIACDSSEKCAVEILESKFCNTKLLEEVNLEGENCLEMSLKTPSIAKHIIDSVHFSKAMLSRKYDDDSTFLMEACQEDNIDDQIMASLLTHKFCDRGVLEDTDDDGWNILHYAAFYRPNIVKLLLGLDFNHNLTCKKIGDGLLPDHLKEFIDDGDIEIGFTYLHTLAIHNPDHVVEIIKVAGINTIAMRDNLGRHFYEYLDNENKGKLNSLDCFKSKILVVDKPTKILCPICHDEAINAISIPCGHAFCSSCLDTIKRQNHMCSICRIKITQTNKLFLP
jgi:ankyrin repeat protein